MQRVEITVFGRVQGVAFRHYTIRQAQSLALTGWVRNQVDGSVRVVAEGGHLELVALVEWLKRGPDHARVDHHEIFWSDAVGGFTDFTITG